MPTKDWKIWAPLSWELCAYVTFAGKRNCLYLEMPSDAGFVDANLVCIEAVCKAVPLLWYPSFPWSCHRFWRTAGISHIPRWVKGWNSLKIRAAAIFTSLRSGHDAVLYFSAFTAVKTWCRQSIEQAPKCGNSWEKTCWPLFKTLPIQPHLGLPHFSVPFLLSLLSWPDCAQWDGLSLRWDGQHSHVQTATSNSEVSKPKTSGYL